MLIYPQTKVHQLADRILREVDKKLVKVSRGLRNSLRFGSKPCKTSIESLTLLRDIYKDKISGADWLCHYDLHTIEQMIKKELRKI